MKKKAKSSLVFSVFIGLFLLSCSGGVSAKGKIIHDAEHYILEAQHG